MMEATAERFEGRRYAQFAFIRPQVIWFFIHNVVSIVLISHLRESSQLNVMEDIRKMETERNWPKVIVSTIILGAILFLQYNLLQVYTMFHFVPRKRLSTESAGAILKFFTTGIMANYSKSTTAVAFTMTLVGSFALPFFTRQIFKTTKWVAFQLTFLRSVFMYVLPIWFTIYYSSSCGRRWVEMWQPCEQSQRTENFDVSLPIFPYETILRGDEICSKEDWGWIMDPDSYTNCGRSVLSLVGWLLFEKMLISVAIMPALLSIVSFCKLQLRKYVDSQENPNLFHRTVPKIISRSVRFDSEFATLVTYIDTLVLWGFMIPPLVPLCYFATANHAVVLWWQKQIEMMFYPANYEAAMYILYLSFIFNQILTLFFCSASGSNDGLSENTKWAILSICILTWIFIVWSLWHENRYKKRKFDKHDSIVFTPGVGLSFRQTTTMEESLKNAQANMNLDVGAPMGSEQHLNLTNLSQKVVQDDASISAITPSTSDPGLFGEGIGTEIEMVQEVREAFKRNSSQNKDEGETQPKREPTTTPLLGDAVVTPEFGGDDVEDTICTPEEPSAHI